MSPVRWLDGRAKLTNLPWVLEEAALARALGVKAVWLLNDLVATATAVPNLGAAEIVTLNAGKPVAGGTIAVIAPGTGLGEAFLTWNGGRYRAYASEGGHATFGPATPDEAALYLYVRERFGHVSYERVCSGIGMPNLYAFYRDRRHAAESPRIAAQLAEAPEHEQARVIIDGALEPMTPRPVVRGGARELRRHSRQRDREPDAEDAQHRRRLYRRRHSPRASCRCCRRAGSSRACRTRGA